jgi:predicted SAM-dependent methyltransferase
MKIISAYRLFTTKLQLKRQIRKDQASLRIVVGSSGVFEPGWIPTNIDTLNLLKRRDWEDLFRPNSINAILAEHVWEHLTLDEGLLALKHCFEFLKSGGYLRIAVPDGFHPDPGYLEYVRVNGSGSGADDHKVLYNHRILGDLLAKAGFKAEPLEYFDESGAFHAVEWNPETGKINRSIRFDSRNADGRPHYISLIMDGVKA